MNNVRNPVRTLKIAGPLGLGICAVLYLLANVAYFAAATKARISLIRLNPAIKLKDMSRKRSMQAALVSLLCSSGTYSVLLRSVRCRSLLLSGELHALYV
jgi:amino acid transporter